MLENQTAENRSIESKSTENNHPFVYVKASKIHGKGLFAKCNIKAGQVLGVVQGKPTRRDGPYVLWFEENRQGFEVQCMFKYINHRKPPNAAYYDDMTVVALKNIKKGEEITHDYGEEWRDD